MLKVKPQHIKVLEVGVTHQLFLPQEHGSDKQIPISVTLIDSNHIKGSVMFLFEGEHFHDQYFSHAFLYISIIPTHLLIF
jgi:hypothetical protein